MKFFRFFIKITFYLYSVSLFLIAIANTGWINPNWPFELFASYSRQALLVFPLFWALASYGRVKNIWRILLPLGVLAFWPLIPTQKYAKGDPDICDSGKCVTLLYANLRDDPKAFNAVRKMARQESANIITMSELPPFATQREIKKWLPDYPYLILIDAAPDHNPLGSVMLIASKFPFVDTDLYVEDYPRKPRAIAKVSVQGPEKFDLLLTHPRIPLSLASIRRRDGLLSFLPKLTDQSEAYVIAGDFNMTPWVPAFQTLPGKRAGDPRLTYSWKAEVPIIGIPIDHFMIGRKIKLGEYRVLAKSGSDHLPILIKFQIN